MTREEIIQGLYRGDGRAIKEAIKELEQKPCEDVISREDVIKAVDHHTFDTDDGLCLDDDISIILEELPPVTPTRKKGKWLNKDASGYHFYGKCSECGQEFCVDAWYTQNMKFCPNCGSLMMKED